MHTLIRIKGKNYVRTVQKSIRNPLETDAKFISPADIYITTRFPGWFYNTIYFI
jgi:hypothetical protein